LASQQPLADKRDGDGSVIIHLRYVVERRRHYSDYGECVLVEFEGLPDDRGIRAESLLPILMAKHDHGLGAWLVVFISNGPSLDRFHPQAGVIAARHTLSIYDLRLVSHHCG